MFLVENNPKGSLGFFDFRRFFDFSILSLFSTRVIVTNIVHLFALDPVSEMTANCRKTGRKRKNPKFLRRHSFDFLFVLKCPNGL